LPPMGSEADMNACSLVRWIGASLCIFAGATFAQALGWQQLPGTANDVGVGANGAAWMVGTNATSGGFGIYRWNAATNNWDQMPGGAVRIDVDPQGNAWIVDSSDKIFRWDGSRWIQVPGAAKDVGIGANGAVWVVGTNKVAGGYGIYRWDNNNWTQLPGVGGVRIDVDPRGFAWVVNEARNVFRFETSGFSWYGSKEKWIPVPGAALDVGIGANGAVYVVGQDNGVYQWTGSGWTKRDGAFTDISVDQKGNPWGVNSSKAIYASGYAKPPPVIGGRYTGIVISVNSSRGDGLIAPDDGSPNVYWHFSQISPAVGQKILVEGGKYRYTLQQGPRGVIASDIETAR